jgi:hypothetical protein
MPKAQTPANARWWSDFHRDYGMGSTHESAFTGYLYTHQIAGLEAPPEVLTQAHADFVAYMAASQALQPALEHDLGAPTARAVVPGPVQEPHYPYSRPLRRR